MNISASILCLSAALIAFVAAAILALWSNAPIGIHQPNLTGLTDISRWSDGDDEVEHERVASKAVADYVASVHEGLESTGDKLRKAIGFR
jgi:hypothetical protein